MGLLDNLGALKKIYDEVEGKAQQTLQGGKPQQQSGGYNQGGASGYNQSSGGYNQVNLVSLNLLDSCLTF